MDLSDFEVRKAIADLVGGREVYDLGCGEAPFVKDLYGRLDYSGIDGSDMALTLAMRANPFYRFSRHDLSKGPIAVPDGLAEVVLLVDVLDEFESLEVAEYVFAEAARISRDLFVVWKGSPRWAQNDLTLWKPKIRTGSLYGFEYWGATRS
jgi:hypothetical protein